MHPLWHWKSNKYHIFWASVCSLWYPACNVHVPYYNVICDLSIFAVFLHIISQMAWSLKKVIEHIMCVFVFCLQLLSETFHILRRTEQDVIRNVYWCSYKVPVILIIFLMKIDFQKPPNYLILWKSVKWEPHCSMQKDGWLNTQTGRHDKAISHCHNFVNTPKNVVQYSYCPQK